MVKDKGNGQTIQASNKIVEKLPNKLILSLRNIVDFQWGANFEAFFSHGI
jgi:hypothetical protein